MLFKKKVKKEKETQKEQVIEKEEQGKFEMDTEDDELIDFGDEESQEEPESIEEEEIKEEERETREQNESGESEQSNTEIKLEDEPKDMVLYIISDKDSNDILKFMRECGLVVDRVFDSIEDMKNALLFLDIPCRIVVIDSGSGKFSNITMRKELIDLIGIADEQNKISIFYTDSSIKSDASSAIGKKRKEIDWAVYENIMTIVATLMTNKEHYVYDYEDSIEDLDIKCLLDSKGIEAKIKQDKQFIEEIDIRNLQNSIDNENEEQLEKYETVY